MCVSMAGSKLVVNVMAVLEKMKKKNAAATCVRNFGATVLLKDVPLSISV